VPHSHGRAHFAEATRAKERPCSISTAEPPSPRLCRPRGGCPPKREGTACCAPTLSSRRRDACATRFTGGCATFPPRSVEPAPSPARGPRAQEHHGRERPCSISTAEPPSRYTPMQRLQILRRMAYYAIPRKRVKEHFGYRQVHVVPLVARGREGRGRREQGLSGESPEDSCTTGGVDLGHLRSQPALRSPPHRHDLVDNLSLSSANETLCLPPQ